MIIKSTADVYLTREDKNDAAQSEYCHLDPSIMSLLDWDASTTIGGVARLDSIGVTGWLEKILRRYLRRDSKLK